MHMVPTLPWPRAVPRIWMPLGELKYDPVMDRVRGMSVFAQADWLAEQRAILRAADAEQRRLSATTGTWSEVIWANTADGTALASSASEGSLLTGLVEQPTLFAGFFYGERSKAKIIRLVARGVLGTTSTPTIVFQVRMGTTSGPSTLSGTSIGVSSAITTASGVSTKQWELVLDLTLRTPGIGTGNSTLFGAGWVTSPEGFASPFTYSLQTTSPSSDTWTTTFDNSVNQYINISATWGTSSASNTCKLKQCMLLGLN